MKPILTTDLAACRALLKKHGRSYYWATGFLPKTEREATTVLYAFFRTADEIVDGDRQAPLARTRLGIFRRQWRQAWQTGETEDPVLRAMLTVVSRYRIPYQLTEEFLDAMQADLTVKRYHTYDDLRRYMDGSAGTVGQMMCHVIGYTDERALVHAVQLGQAMQLTNFLRDVGEDYERGRIYLPRTDLVRFGVSEAMIDKRTPSREFQALMQFEISRCRELYAAASAGIAFLHRPGRRAIRVASGLYAAILHQIESRGYEVFSQRVHTTSAQKIYVAMRASFRA